MKEEGILGPCFVLFSSSHKKMRAWGLPGESKVGLLLIFTGLFFKKRREKTPNSLKFPHSQLHAVNAKTKGGVRAKFTVQLL